MSLEFKDQLAGLAVRIAGSVAEKIQERAMQMSREERRKIEEMLEHSLADIVVNAISNTPTFKTTAGLKYAEENFNNIVDMYVQKLTGKI
jgi:uncharacterized protein YigA (DUF484 family)